ncbi:MAG: hypothetical protein JHC31_15605, partial [Sulfurihydrogenibium sp.]|nr:hypothetical protein [Sulfurihydrogenibium sp.]
MQVKDAIKKSLFAGIIISTPFLPTLIEKMDTAHLMYAVEFTDSLTKEYYRASPESTIPIAYRDIKKAEKEIVEEINNQFYNGRKEIDENRNIAIDVIYDGIYDKAFIGIKDPQKSTKLSIYRINTNNFESKKAIETASANGQLKELRNKYILTEKSDILEKILKYYSNPESITKFISIFTIHNLTNPYDRTASLKEIKNIHESEIINRYKNDKEKPTGYYIQESIALNLNSMFPIKIDKERHTDSIRNTMILDPSLHKNIIKITKSLNGNNSCLNLYLLSKTDLPLFSYYTPLSTTYKENNIYPTVYTYPSWIDQNLESRKNTIKKETSNYINNTTKTDDYYNTTSEEISVFYNTDYKKLWEKCNNYEIKKLATPYSNKLDEYDIAY